jgi:glycerol-3-phosphate acyltransferase PlsY
VTAAEAMAVGAALVAAYLLGSVPSGVLVGRLWRGVDVRQHGSGQTGATNVLRTIGWKAAAIVTVLDVGKGTAAMLLGGWLAGTEGNLVAGIAVLTGHNWPVWVGFRGGRGVMPAVGASLVIVPIAAVVGIAFAAMVIGVSRYVSLGSMAGTVSCCAIMLGLAVQGSEPVEFAPLAMAGGSLIVFRHRENIIRLLRGTERRLGDPA